MEWPKWQGRKMSEKRNSEGKKMPRTITSISFNITRGRGDGELISLANEFAHLPDHEGIPPTSLIRNFFIRKFREAIKAARSRELMAS